MPNKRFPREFTRWFAAALLAAVFLGGCAPSGPKALLDGERLIREGKPGEAIEKLRIAVQLLPDNPQAWNHLGLALHAGGRGDEAGQAYREALKRNPNLAAAHFNLGMLSLERNDLQTAISELTSHTVLNRDSVEAWTALGEAQLRAKQFDAAEKSFQAALQLKPASAAAFNGLGMIRAERRRIRDAATMFSNALRADPNHAPALLNLAVLMQPFDIQGALQRYRAYVQLKPAPANASEVAETIRQIEASLAVTQARIASQVSNSVVKAPVPAPTPTNTVVVKTSAPPTVASVKVAPASTPNLNPAPAPSPAIPPVAEKPAPSTKPQLAEVKKPQPEPPKPTVAAAVPPVKQPEPKPAPAPTKPKEEPAPEPAQEIRVAETPQPKPPVDVPLELPRTETAAPTPAAAKTSAPAPSSTVPEAAAEKPTLVQRLNPMRWFGGGTKPAPITTPLDRNPQRRPTEKSASAPQPANPSLLAKADIQKSKEEAVAQQAGDSIAEKSAIPARPSTPPPPAPSLPPVPRYAYSSPAAPAAGDRATALAAMARGIQAHEQRRLPEAAQSYQEAARLDPSLYEAQYNLGLAAYELKDWPLSLSSYEKALSINPTAANARFNFALALDRAGYPLDAVSELEKIASDNPAESRVHFSLAKIYSETLQRPEAAARHYRRTLELEPGHPQAVAIRRWLMQQGTAR